MCDYRNQQKGKKQFHWNKKEKKKKKSKRTLTQTQRCPAEGYDIKWHGKYDKDHYILAQILIIIFQMMECNR